MKALKRSLAIGMLIAVLAGCREFTVFATPTPVVPVPVVNAQTPALPTAVPLPINTPDKLVVSADEVDALLTNLYERANRGVVNIGVSAGVNMSEFGTGSGFVIDTDGHIVTNNHVVQDADEIDVTFWDGSVATAKLIATDSYSDLAVVKVTVKPSELYPLVLGDSDQVKVGQRVVAIGNPFGLVGTMTVGIISGKGRSLPADSPSGLAQNYSNPDILQTDAAINPGNSGGPLLDSQGEVIGVNSAIRTDGTNRANSGVGFAVPSNTVKRVTEQLLKNGRVAYPYLGIKVDSHFTTPELAQALNLPVEKGVLIASVIDGGPAEQVGLRGGSRQVTVRGLPVQSGGDIIIAIDNDPVNSFDEMISYLTAKKQVGQTVTITFIRDGETLQVPLTLTERPQ